MENKDEKGKSKRMSRRDFVRLSGRGIVCTTMALVPVNAVCKEEGEHTATIFQDLPVYRTENIMKVTLSEGETACTGDPVRPSEKCTGCMSCVAICSLSHEGISSSALSGIRIHHSISEWALRESQKMYDFAICRQCPGVPPCDQVCPEHAHYRSEKHGAVLVNHSKCIRCGACAEACPYNACWYSEALDKIVKCDLCDGNNDGPRCVEHCTSAVLKLEEVV